VVGSQSQTPPSFAGADWPSLSGDVTSPLAATPVKYRTPTGAGVAVMVVWVEGGRSKICYFYFFRTQNVRELKVFSEEKADDCFVPN
jgi:hypothetical protein